MSIARLLYTSLSLYVGDLTMYRLISFKIQIRILDYLVFRISLLGAWLTIRNDPNKILIDDIVNTHWL